MATEHVLPGASDGRLPEGDSDSTRVYLQYTSSHGKPSLVERWHGDASEKSSWKTKLVEPATRGE